MTPTYLGDIELNEETLAHYGVKGMKWGKRKKKPDHSKNRWKKKREEEQRLKDAYNNAKTYEERAAIRTAFRNELSRTAFGNTIGYEHRKRNNPYTVDMAAASNPKTVQRETIAKDRRTGKDVFEWQVHDYSKNKKKKKK